MSLNKKIIIVLATLFLWVKPSMANDSTLIANDPTLDSEDILYLQLKDGLVIIQTFPDKAPNHVERIKELAKEKFYDGIVFHRVIDGFMAQTGDPTGTGAGGSDKPDLEAEFNDVSHKRGIVSMARTMEPDSANSQFFIMINDQTYLDGQYTVWGRVIQGMEHVDNIKKGTGANGSVKNPDHILSLRVAADIEDTDASANEEATRDTESEALVTEEVKQ